jgi:hypothetical protein
MSHIDTLKVYEEYRAAGFSDIKARTATQVLEQSFIAKVNELKEDFASNKLIAILGSIIIAIGGFTLNKVWDLSHDMVEVKTRLVHIEAKNQ